MRASSHRTALRVGIALAAAGAAIAGAMLGCARFTDKDLSTSIGYQAPAAGVGGYGSPEAQAAASIGCMTCHEGIESPSMHASNLVRIGCAHCHGGDPTVGRPTDSKNTKPYDAAYLAAKKAAHVAPHFPEAWPTAGNPVNSYALLNNEKLEFVRFVNPGDLRVAPQTCGPCHPSEAHRVPTSIMAHSAMVPGSGLYNNGVAPWKNYVVGEFYAPNGTAGKAVSDPPPTEAEKKRGVLAELLPYPRFEISEPGNQFRVLERGIAGTRGLGTLAKVDGAVITVHKTRLNDPNLWFLGTNDYAGEYRSSGCSACHVLYANDDTAASGPIALAGHDGRSATADPTISRDEHGHPIQHRLTRSIPSSQCLTCHIHQGSGALGNYVGVEWWDGETDGAAFYNQDGSAKWGDELHDTHALANGTAKNTQFVATHRSGWSFHKIYRRDQEGQLLDKDGNVVSPNDPGWAKKAVHLVDAHFEAGMHCIDCHTEQDVHGDGKLYGEMVDAVEIDCSDCHGTIGEKAKLKTSNPAGGHDLLYKEGSNESANTRTPFGAATPQFEWRDGGKTLVQHSKVEPNKEWVVPQLVDMVDPASPKYNRKAAVAKTLQRDGKSFGDAGLAPDKLAHGSDRITCYACHVSWAVSCQGCHLAARANVRQAAKHYFGEFTKGEVGYYSQGLRHDSFMLGINGDVKGNKISPVRSASAVCATVEDGNRAIVVNQQPTISSAGFSGTAFTPYPPHTFSSKYGQACTACHVSEADDNNARLATLFVLGSHSADFVGDYVHLATGTGGVEAIRVTEGFEPQPVIGSDFHKITHPESFAAFEKEGRRLDESFGHSSENAQSVQARGEFLFIADGPGGFRVFDIANIANKDAAQRIVTAPLSPLGQQAHVDTKDATAVLLPSTVPLDPKRVQDPANREQKVEPLFGFAFVTDRLEGLITVDVNTFVDGNPDNNFIERAATFNPEGKLAGANGGAVVGHYVYVLTARGLAVVDVKDAAKPRFVTEVTEGLKAPRALDVQFRYAALVDAEGMKVLDVTNLEAPALVAGATVPLPDARSVRVSRTYAYVAAGREGIAIVDVKKFREPKLMQKFDAEGQINDANAVVTGLTNASFFAYVADGKNGLRVVELWTPSRSTQTDGYSPPPMPRLIATGKTASPAIAISTGQQRDRGVDESGEQMSVFGRLGSRPLNGDERGRFYLKDGKPYTVKDDASGYTDSHAKSK
jgi:LVIVD repeat-containing protein